jgi:ComF family protein
MKLFRAILNILLPVNCVSCTRPGDLICQECLLKIPKPFEQINEWTISVFRYKHSTTRKIVWNLKYRNSHYIAKDIAPFLHDHLIDFLGEKMSTENEAILLTPIPLTKKRFRERGFNQSEILAKEIEKQNPELFKTKNLLKKIRETEPQAKIKQRTKRLQNLKGAFVLGSKEGLTDKTVVLVDDITTTGATLREAKRVLKEAGFKKIFAVTIGH